MWDERDRVDLRPQAERSRLSPEGNGEPWKGSKQGQHWDRVQDEPQGRDWRSEEVGVLVRAEMRAVPGLGGLENGDRIGGHCMEPPAGKPGGVGTPEVP